MTMAHASTPILQAAFFKDSFSFQIGWQLEGNRTQNFTTFGRPETARSVTFQVMINLIFQFYFNNSILLHIFHHQFNFIIIFNLCKLLPLWSSYVISIWFDKKFLYISPCILRKAKFYCKFTSRVSQVLLDSPRFSGAVKASEALLRSLSI